MNFSRWLVLEENMESLDSHTPATLFSQVKTSLCLLSLLPKLLCLDVYLGETPYLFVCVARFLFPRSGSTMGKGEKWQMRYFELGFQFWSFAFWNFSLPCCTTCLWLYAIHWYFMPHPQHSHWSLTFKPGQAALLTSATLCVAGRSEKVPQCQS